MCAPAFVARTSAVDNMENMLLTFCFCCILICASIIFPAITSLSDPCTFLYSQVKESTLKVMKELADKLFLGGREIPQYPFGEALPEEQVAAAAAAETKQDEELDPLNKLIKSNEATMVHIPSLFLALFSFTFANIVFLHFFCAVCFLVCTYSCR